MSFFFAGAIVVVVDRLRLSVFDASDIGVVVADLMGLMVRGGGEVDLVSISSSEPLGVAASSSMPLCTPFNVLSLLMG